MTVEFNYEKKQVLDGLRSHFFGRPEIRVLFIVINVFAIISAILLYFKKIQAISFLLFSILWFLLWISVRRLLPLSIYKKSQTFKDQFSLSIEEQGVLLQSGRGQQFWQWQHFSHYKETVHFFLLYFNGRSFFMVPKDAFRNITEVQGARQMFREMIGK